MFYIKIVMYKNYVKNYVKNCTNLNLFGFLTYYFFILYYNMIPIQIHISQICQL
jgi:hypothetical protein